MTKVGWPHKEHVDSILDRCLPLFAQDKTKCKHSIGTDETTVRFK